MDWDQYSMYGKETKENIAVTDRLCTYWGARITLLLIALLVFNYLEPKVRCINCFAPVDM